MERSKARAKYETQLARAHRSLYWASVAAEELGDLGAVDDVTQIMLEVNRLTEDSLRGRKRTREPIPGQLTI